MREFELQKIRLQNETQRVVGSQPLPSGPKRYVKACETLSVGRQVSPKKPERLPKRKYLHEVPNERSPLKCYGCGKPGVIKSKCPTCNPNSSQRTGITTNHINVNTAQTISPRLTLIDIIFCGKKAVYVQTQGLQIQLLGKRCTRYSKTKDFSSRKPRWQ
ncbi:uncharacterized protein TNCT_564731 [Trichonephila clavata]|uniref:CCHC-type domain-containing protein n=1 Tax=Trichonephila clavata TaxID=2740835 RepID=A0A8X6EY92_TRICU|nr:uncharacterized protein TNCT_564731 [Trichonephila clavata]